jgi:hypothetical protein
MKSRCEREKAREGGEIGILMTSGRVDNRVTQRVG